MSIELSFKLSVEFVNCPKCNKGPLNYKQETIDKFMRDHIGHVSLDSQYPRIVGHIKKPTKLKGQKVAVRFVVDPPKEIVCRWKKCKSYKEGTKEFCSKQCKKQYKKYKKERK